MVAVPARGITGGISIDVAYSGTCAATGISNSWPATWPMKNNPAPVPPPNAQEIPPRHPRPAHGPSATQREGQGRHDRKVAGSLRGARTVTTWRAGT
jgi:hypothetical protein